jgi:hypothetical protein
MRYTPTIVTAGTREAGVKRAIVIMMLVSSPALADVVHLRGGGKITGEIVAQTEDSVTIDIGGGTMAVRSASIVGIEESVSPLQKYRARAAEIPADDIDAWRDLARWATGEALSSQAGEAWANVLAVLPDDPEANRALGMVQLGGRWVTEEEAYRERGFIQFEGQWMTPNERQRILSERDARAEAERREIDAKIQEIEAEQKAEKERQRKQEEARERARNPISWGWGAGPRYWPHPVRRWP